MIVWIKYLRSGQLEVSTLVAKMDTANVTSCRRFVVKLRTCILQKFHWFLHMSSLFSFGNQPPFNSVFLTKLIFANHPNLFIVLIRFLFEKSHTEMSGWSIVTYVCGCSANLRQLACPIDVGRFGDDLHLLREYIIIKVGRKLYSVVVSCTVDCTGICSPDFVWKSSVDNSW